MSRHGFCRMLPDLSCIQAVQWSWKCTGSRCATSSMILQQIWVSRRQPSAMSRSFHAIIRCKTYSRGVVAPLNVHLQASIGGLSHRLQLQSGVSAPEKIPLMTERRASGSSRLLTQFPNDKKITSKGGQGKAEPGANSPSNATPSLGRAAAGVNVQTGVANHLKGRLPSINPYHRPSREELLAAATGFWSRLKIRFKWLTIRSARPFNVDEIGAFFSWILLGHVLWIILGTTTFFSLAIFAVNTVFAQEALARWVGNYLTKSSGVNVIFESAIVPKWGDGVITLKNVFVSRRPGLGSGHVSKGSPATEAAAAAAVARSVGDTALVVSREDHEEASNFTQFDLSIDTVNVTLSFRKWFNSKGLLRDVEVRGVRGVVDRTSIDYTGEYVDPRTYRHEHNPGDFEIDSFRMQDLLVTVHQPNDFRPFSVAVFTCDLPRLRRQWLFYDFLSANTISGTIDNSIFNLHPRQDHSIAGRQFDNRAGTTGTTDLLNKCSRLRVDALNVEHLNRGIEGPLSWIHEGHVDIVADIVLPADADESITKLMSDFYDRIEATVSKRTSKSMSSQGRTTEVAGETASSLQEEDQRLLVMDLKIHLNDVRAAVPLFTKDLSYVNNALVRPIVAYMNSRKTFIPIHCRVIKRTSEFDGSWTIFDSGLMDDISAETYQAFARDVKNDQARLRRFRKVGLWSIQLAAQAFFMGLAGSFA